MVESDYWSINRHIPDICRKCAACDQTVVSYDYTPDGKVIAVELSFDSPYLGSGTVTVARAPHGGGRVVSGRCPTGKL